MAEFTGGCLCGAVTYEGSEPQGGGDCYCVDCRKTSGTSYGSHLFMAADNLSVKGEVKFYDHPTDSGNVVSRGFCPNCGSPVYSKNSGMPEIAFVRASSLDDLEVFKPQMTVYTSSAPSWANFNPDLPQFEKMPPMDENPLS